MTVANGIRPPSSFDTTSSSPTDVQSSTLRVFLTVGTQLPFDRLVTAVDRWAAANPEARVVAQTCTARDGYTPRHFERVVKMLDADACAQLMSESDVTIAHAGMGTILTALDLGKRLIVMPRRASLGEHRNDHQWATTQRMQQIGLVEVANDADELARLLKATSSVAARRAAAIQDRGPTTRRLADALIRFVRDADRGRTSGASAKRPHLAGNAGPDNPELAIDLA